MDDVDIDNEFLNDNFQEEIKNTQSLKSDSYNNEENLYELNDDTFQISTNTKDNRTNDYSKLGRQTKSKNNNNNIFMETPQNKSIYNNYNNINVNEDISGISLLKELEEQWNNIEKQKMSYYNRNKGDESKSTNSNTKNNSKYEKYKYLKEFVELKKNKFLSMRQKAKNIRENDQEIEQFFLIKFKEMEKYKIIDNNLKKQIEIRQQEKMNEDMNQNTDDNNYNENNYENYEKNDSNQNIKDKYQLNYNYDDFNNANEYNNKYNKYYEDEKSQQRTNNIFNKKSYIQNNNNPGNKNIFYENIGSGNPELDDLIYETPARNNNNILYNNQINDKNMIQNMNMNMNLNNIEENKNNNISIQNIYKSQKNLISGKLIEKMKNLFEEINGQNSQRSKNEAKMNSNNNIRKQTNSYESGVLGINNISIINHDYTDNDILMNIRNTSNANTTKNKNKKDINLIGDSNKSININLNFDYSNNIMNNSTNYNKYKNKDSSFIKNNNIEKSMNDNSINISKNIFIQENNDELSSLQKNFDDIMNKIKSGYNNVNSTKNSNKYNLMDNNDNNGINNDDNEDREFDKYFEELSKEAKIKVKQNKGGVGENQVNKYEFGSGENKIKNKIKESSEYLNKFVSEMNQNKNRFKQRMMAINNNLNNIKIKGDRQRSLSGYKLSRVNLKNNFNENI